MEYNIKAIPTKYQGRQYRSQLEARWAAMFDLLEWRFEYEPFVLGGWLVDFLIFGEKEILVEVKPTINLYEFPLIKIQKATQKDKREILLIGHSILIDDDVFDGVAIGYLNDRISWEEGQKESIDCYGKAVVNKFQGYGFIHNFNSWKDRITGIYTGNESVLIPDKNEVIRLWNDAGNQVMYKK